MTRSSPDSQMAHTSAKDVCFDHALNDLRQGADLSAPVRRRNNGVDALVYPEVSPLLAQAAQGR